MPVLVRGCVHPRGLPNNWYKGVKYLRQKEILEKVLSLPGTSSLDEHEGGGIGRVIGSYVDKHGQIFVDIEIPDDAPDYERIKNDLVSGKYAGLSLGRKHKIDVDTGELVKTSIFEVSVCEKGAVPGTYIEAVSVASAEKAKYGNLGNLGKGGGTGIYELPPVVDVTDLKVVTSASGFPKFGGKRSRQLSSPSIPGACFTHKRAKHITPKQEMSTNPTVTTPSSQEMLQDMAAPVLGIFNAAKAAAGRETASTPGEAPAGAAASLPPSSGAGATPVPSTTSLAGGDAAGEAAAASGKGTDTASAEESRGTKRGAPEKAVIDKEKYDALLEQQAEIKRMKKQMEDQQKEIDEWRSLRDLTGGSKASEIAARVASARQREIDEFKAQVDEALPLIERRYREASESEQNFIRPYLDSFRMYADNPEKVGLDAMESARGFMGLITGQAREYNTSIAEKDAQVKALEARCAAEAGRADEADQRLQTLVSTSSAKRKTIAPFNPEEHGLERTSFPERTAPTSHAGPTTAPPPAHAQGPSAPNPFSSFGTGGSVFGSIEPKRFSVYHSGRKTKEEIEAMPFHFRPEEQYINYFPEDQREEARKRAAPAEKLFSDIGRSHSRFYTTTPMHSLFQPIKESDMGNLHTVKEEIFARTRRPGYY
jgi:hypothetical protein